MGFTDHLTPEQVQQLARYWLGARRQRSLEILNQHALHCETCVRKVENAYNQILREQGGQGKKS